MLPFAPTAEDEKGTELRQDGAGNNTRAGRAGSRTSVPYKSVEAPFHEKAMARERRSRAMWLNSFGGLQG